MNKKLKGVLKEIVMVGVLAVIVLLVSVWLQRCTWIAEAEEIQIEVFEISAYTSRECETDSSPTITSTGQKVRDGIVAVGRKIMPDGAYTREPFLPYGTRLKIDGEVYVVADIMNKRYQGRYLDIFFVDLEDALEFGRKKLSVEIL